MKKNTTVLSTTENETLLVIKDRAKNYKHVPIRIADIAFYCMISWSAAQARVKKLIARKLIKRNKKGEITLN